MLRKDFLAGYMAGRKSMRKKAQDLSGILVDNNGHEYSFDAYGEQFDVTLELSDWHGDLVEVYEHRETVDDALDEVKADYGLKEASRKKAMRKKADAYFVCYSDGDGPSSTNIVYADSVADAEDKYSDHDWVYVRPEPVKDYEMDESMAKGMPIVSARCTQAGSRSAGKFYDKLFDENDRVHESFYGDGSDGRKYEIEIWESSEPGTWGQSNFNYSVTDVDTGEWIRYRDWYFMTMDALWDRLDKDLDELGIRL